jgi:L-methionine (R)-S-oxide reductase
LAHRWRRWAAQMMREPLGRTSRVSVNSTVDEVLDQLRSILAAPDDRTRRACRAAEAIRDARGYRWVGLYDVAATEIISVGWSGTVAPAFPRFPIDRGLNGAAVRTARPVVVQDVSVDPRYLTTFASTGAEAILPVVSSSTGKVVGTIDAESDRTNAFTSDDDAFLSACARALFPLWLKNQS